jgi:hypothetical protein
LRHHPSVGGFGLALLFIVLTCAFAGMAVAGAIAGGRGWVIAVAAALLAGWMSTFAAAALRRMRR